MTHLLLPIVPVAVVVVAVVGFFVYARINSANSADNGSSESSSGDTRLSFTLETDDFSLNLPTEAQNDDFYIGTNDILTTINRPYGKLQV